ncbi:hypothetical protein GCM10012320_34100 [Sinomonas cellulolyticus]|uniref:hypothetical protein n=1 Tax=Sinomonas cellulolyticus TaxID=2801916 RepID=UPI0019929583|nr:MULTISPECIES: hypothetical protein [Sinomonas]GHG59846.1 hypothetical protein GCM10012320_34100 [Sinomonas sp. KCTC 49339]
MAGARPGTATSIAGKARDKGLTVRGYVSMCFGDPWEGPVDAPAVTECTRALLDAGCDQVSLGDTIGTATPGHVLDLIDRHATDGIGAQSLALHLHDTYGQALANVLAGLLSGVTCFDSSTGGIGGCPFAQSATGNLATEDLVWMLDGLGINTGIDLDAVTRAGAQITRLLGRETQSKAGTAILGAALKAGSL